MKSRGPAIRFLIGPRHQISNWAPQFLAPALLLVSLRRNRFGIALSDTTRHILNHSGYDLPDNESYELSHLNFGLPSRYLCREEIFAEFESLWVQLLHDSAISHVLLYNPNKNGAHFSFETMISQTQVFQFEKRQN